ncbi:hypothetical protein EV421DRAFT_788697 [Armillaria borealis]|uniref:RRM domain-containing protein n=1 Tax=Armillaria borealis TaxID=47425 RepID=A0AA39MNI0_9AGAR|nr:hypothetical protein EV421DRAFT_788697 [Armillaria borealis]
MSTLGKRKERDEEPIGHGSTLFVSNLPYTATSVDLQTLFSDIAPVRSAFVVTEAGTGVSKGVGYVSFAIKEDAQAAFDKISTDGIALVGRNLRVQWAENKPKDKTEKVKVEAKPKQIPNPRPRAPQDPLAIRTIVVTGLPSSVDSKSLLWKKFRKYKGAESVEWPVDEGAAHVLFSTPSAAHDAVDKLHAHVYKGSLLSVTLKKRLDSLAKASKADTKTAAPNHSSRLIIRNTPFNITEQDLRALFLPYGPIHSIHIPKGKDSGRSRGFAFVWMLSKKDAEKAMESCNGKVIRAGMAEGMVSDKQKKKKQRRLEKKMQQGEGANGDDDNDEAQEAENSSERTIAVDWALSKDKWEEEKTRMEEDDDAEMEDASSEKDEESDEEEQLGVHDGTDEDADDSSDEENENDEEPVKPQLPPPETGTTLFIRNVPFTATEDELRTLFRAFGPLRYARITLDGSTGRSRGTGFACFWNKEDADKVVEQSDLLKAETTGAESAPKKNPFSMPSILTPDPSSSLAQSLVLHGRTLDVVRAVTRDEAGKLKEEGERRREKADKRNMYLLREGVILPNSPAAQVMVQAELERRNASFGARKALLNSNPSLYVSKTRLSIRQIPIFVSERVLKRLALYAAREFESDVKKGERNGLTADELAVEADRKGQLDDDEASGKKNKKKPDSRVKQAKIIRQHERVDVVTGKGRSKGYGFVEMHTHADSLRVLRWANNNPSVGKLLQEWYKDELKDLIKAEKGKGKEKDEARLKRLQDEQEKAGPAVKGTLIVEFSIENVQVVQRRSTQQRERVTNPDKEKKGKKDKKKEVKADVEEQPSEQERPAKKVRTEGTAKKGPGRSLGSLIGRKRKERKGKH